MVSEREKKNWLIKPCDCNRKKNIFYTKFMFEFIKYFYFCLYTMRILAVFEIMSA